MKTKLWRNLRESVIFLTTLSPTKRILFEFGKNKSFWSSLPIHFKKREDENSGRGKKEEEVEEKGKAEVEEEEGKEERNGENEIEEKREEVEEVEVKVDEETWL